MLYFYSGTDREKNRDQVSKLVALHTKSYLKCVRISDAHTLGDLDSVLTSGGMFSESRIIVFEYISSNLELFSVIIESLPNLKKSSDIYIILEDKIDAATQKQISKYAELFEKNDVTKGVQKAATVFDVANAIKRGDKKSAWIALTHALMTEAPEAVHGIMFWGAKDMYLKARSDSERVKAGDFVARLSVLPHESRRRGYELEYALEHFVLSM